MQTKFFERLAGNQGAALRLAALLLVITLSIFASKLWEETYVSSLRDDCNSLFSDRLIPMTALYHVNDALHHKRDTLKQFLGASTASRAPAATAPPAPAGNVEPVHYVLGQRDAFIEQHVAAIEGTFLVDDEKRLLRELRATLKGYSALENQLLFKQKNGETVAYDDQAQAGFDRVHLDLMELMKVQQFVGAQLKTASATAAGNVKILLYFQLGLAFTLGLIASGLAMTLRPRTLGPSESRKEQLH